MPSMPSMDSATKASLLANADPILSNIDREIAWLIEEFKAGHRKRERLDWSELIAKATPYTAKHIRKYHLKPQFQNMATILLVQSHKRQAFRDLRQRVQEHFRSSPSNGVRADVSKIGQTVSTRSGQQREALRQQIRTNADTRKDLHRGRWYQASRSTLRSIQSPSLLSIDVDSAEPASLINRRSTTAIDYGTLGNEEAHEEQTVRCSPDLLHLVKKDLDGADLNRIVTTLKRPRKRRRVIPILSAAASSTTRPCGPNPRLSRTKILSPTSPSSPNIRRSGRRVSELSPELCELATLWFESERKYGSPRWTDMVEEASLMVKGTLEKALKTPRFTESPLEVLVEVKDRRKFQLYQQQLAILDDQRRYSGSLSAMMKEATSNLCSRKQYHWIGDRVQIRGVDGDDRWYEGTVVDYKVMQMTEISGECRCYSVRANAKDGLVYDVPEVRVYTVRDAALLQQEERMKGIHVFVDTEASDEYLRCRGWYGTDLTQDAVFSSLLEAMQASDDALVAQENRDRRVVLLQQLHLPDEWNSIEPVRQSLVSPNQTLMSSALAPIMYSDRGSSDGNTTKAEESTLSSSSTASSLKPVIKPEVIFPALGRARKWSSNLFPQLLPTSREKLLTEPMKELAYLLEISRKENGVTSWPFCVSYPHKSEVLQEMFDKGQNEECWPSQKIKALIGDNKFLRDIFRAYRQALSIRLTSCRHEQHGALTHIPHDPKLQEPDDTSNLEYNYPPWSPSLFGDLINGAAELLPMERELAYLLESGRAQCGKSLWDWVTRQQMSTDLRTLIAEQSAQNPNWERQKLKSLIGSGKAKSDAMIAYRSAIRQKLLEPRFLVRKLSRTVMPNTITSVGLLSPPSSTSEASSEAIYQEMALLYGQSDYHFGQADIGYILASASQALLRRIVEAYPDTSHRHDLRNTIVPLKWRPKFEQIRAQSCIPRDKLPTSSRTLLTTPLNTDELRACRLDWLPSLFMSLVSASARAALQVEHFELAFLLEKCLLVNGNMVVWMYVSAHEKTKALADLWKRKASLVSFSSHRLQYLVGRSDERMAVFREVRKIFREQMTHQVRRGTCVAGSLPGSPHPSAGVKRSAELSLDQESTLPKRSRSDDPMLPRCVDSYLEAIILACQHGRDQKVSFLEKFLLAHSTLPRAHIPPNWTGMHVLALEQVEDHLKLQRIARVHFQDQSGLFALSSSYLNLRKVQWVSFCKELKSTWTSTDCRKSGFEETQRCLWEYYMEGESAMFELHKQKIKESGETYRAK